MAELPTDKHRRRFKNLKAEFDSNWKPHLKDISDYLMTRKGRFLDVDINPNDGDKRNGLVIDGTGGRAIRILAAGMQSGLTSPARPWFRLGLGDKELEEYAPVRLYLDEVQKRMMTVFSKSNFYTAVHSLYGELGGFGTSAMLIEEDFKHVIRCYPFTVGEYVLGTDSSLRVDTLYRAFDMTAINVVGKFGEKNVSKAVVDYTKNNNKDQWTRIIHGIEPNYDRDATKEDGPNKPWISVYFEETGDNMGKFLRQSGYDMFPVMAPRWDTTGSEVYGRSPGMDTLPDVKMLQKMQEKGLKALDKLVDPPMNAPSKMKETGGTIVSGGVNYVDANQGQQGFTPAYQVQPDFKSMEYKIERVQTAIKEGFFNDLFLMMALSSNKEMTAREVAERHEEKLLAVGPVVERLQPELLDRVIDRTYDIMAANELLPEPPEELEGMDLEVEYISLLAQAQKMVGITAIEQTAAFVIGLSETWPEAKHKFKSVEAVEEFARMAGTSTKVIASDDEVVDKLAAEAQRAAEIQQREDAEQAVASAKSLSETDMDNNSALKELTQAQQ